MSDKLTLDVTATDGRYHRQSLITWWDQALLRDARVLVVGAGALGNELIKNLVLMGVGTILVADLDVIEDSNLSRCVLFRPRDEGRSKAEVAVEAARDLNEEVELIALHGDVRSTIGLGVVRDVDVVLGGLDNREARLFVNQACWKVGTPWVDGAIEGLQGVARAFVPNEGPDEGPCYECTMGERDHQIVAARRSCSLLSRDEMEAGKVPTTATTAAIIAGIQVQEAVKLLHAEGPTGLIGRGYAFNGLTHDSYVVTYARQEECMAHDHYAPEHSEDAPLDATFGDLLALGRERLGLEDVTLQTETELAISGRCEHCETDRPINRPLHELMAPDAVCPVCGEELGLRLVHTIRPDHEEFLGLRPAEIGVAPADVITARHGLERRHLVLGGALPLLERLGAGGSGSTEDPSALSSPDTMPTAGSTAASSAEDAS